MIIKYAEQISFSEFQSSEYDFLIAASGYETRATTLSKKISSKTKNKIAIGFVEHSGHHQRIQNDDIFKSLGFSQFVAKEGLYGDIITVLDEILSTTLFQDKVSVVVDYSCMTKVWYATVLNYFINKYSEIKNLEIHFSYTPSEFSEPQIPMPNKYMGPIPGIYRVSASYKPTALILGLGYERETAKGIMEYLDPQITHAFYTKPSIDERFTQIVENNNAKLIESLGEHFVHSHSMSDLKATDVLLSSLCLSLRKKYRIILAPLGPKPFALMCLLVATKYPDIDVWRVSSGNSGNIYDRLPADIDPIICKTVFEQQHVTTRQLALYAV